MQFYPAYLPPKFQESVAISPGVFLPPLKIRPTVQGINPSDMISDRQQYPNLQNSLQNSLPNNNMHNINHNIPTLPILQNIRLDQNVSKSSSEDEDMSSQDSPEKKDLKERNRVAAQKWRQKKDKYLAELEESNDVLRQQALSLCGQVQSLKVENKLLESELQFFQSFMSKIMNPK